MHWMLGYLSSIFSFHFVFLSINVCSFTMEAYKMDISFLHFSFFFLLLLRKTEQQKMQQWRFKIDEESS